MENTELQAKPNTQLKLADKIQGFGNLLTKYESSVASLLGEKYGMSAKEFMMSIMNIVKKTPKLLDCDPKTLFGAILLSAEFGLKPNTPEGFAWILPYGKEAQFQLGYKGLIEIAYRSPAVKAIKGIPVFANEFYQEFENDTYKHIPYTGMDLNVLQLCSEREKFLRTVLSFEDELIKSNLTEYKEALKKGKGALVLVYAVGYMEGLEKPIWLRVTNDVLNAIEQLSPGAKSSSSPYHNGTDVHNSMQVKAAIKKLAKYLPKQGNAQLYRALEVDDKMMAGSVAIMNDNGEVEVVELETKAIETAEQKKEKLKTKQGDNEANPVKLP